MKSNKFTRVVAGMLVPAVATLGGCYSSGRGKFVLASYEHDNRGALFVPKDNVDIVSGHIYGESAITSRNSITQETVNKAMDSNQKTVDKLVDNPIYRHYQNRK